MIEKRFGGDFLIRETMLEGQRWRHAIGDYVYDRKRSYSAFPKGAFHCYEVTFTGIGEGM